MRLFSIVGVVALALLYGEAQAAPPLDLQEQAVAQQCPKYLTDREAYYRTMEALPPDPSDPARFIEICKEIHNFDGFGPVTGAWVQLGTDLAACADKGAVGTRDLWPRFQALQKERFAHCE